MDADELRKRAAWLEAGAIRFGRMEVAALLQRYADEARGKADALEARSARCSRQRPGRSAA